MMPRVRMIVVALCILPSALTAQRLPSDDRKPALTRKENWGVSLGFDFISAGFQPTRCSIERRLPDGQRVSSGVGPCGGEPVAYSSRGFGVGLNVGVVFLRHVLLGAEAWTVGFGGTRTFAEPSLTSGDGAETTNSLAASAYVGAITSPLGRSNQTGRKVWLGMLAGKSHWSGKRFCTNCRLVPMQMGRPAFLEPFVMFGGGDKNGGGGVRLAYRQHFGGFEAMHSTMTLGMFFAFGKL